MLIKNSSKGKRIPEKRDKKTRRGIEKQEEG